MIDVRFVAKDGQSVEYSIIRQRFFQYATNAGVTLDDASAVWEDAMHGDRIARDLIEDFCEIEIVNADTGNAGSESVIEYLSDCGRFRAVIAEIGEGVEVVLWRSAGTFGRPDSLGRMWKRVERSVFDQPIEIVCRHVEAWLRTLSA